MYKFFSTIILCSLISLMFSGKISAQTKQFQEGQFGRTALISSSTLAPQAGNSYAPMNFYDGDERTAWIEGASDGGIGQWIKVEYDSPMKISSVYFSNGYAKSAKSYSENGRVKDVEISTENGSFTKTVPDSKEEMRIRLPKELAGKNTRWVKLTIKGVYSGTKYNDTAIGEFRPDLEEHNYE